MNLRTMNFGKLFTVLSLAAILFAGCSGEKKGNTKTFEEILKEEGYPVTVQKVTPRKFTKVLKFYGTFEGERQTVIGAMIGGRIEKINFKPGDNVKKDDVIIEFPEDSPASKYQQAKAAYENSKKTYERMKALYEKGQIAQAQFEGAETKYLVDKRNYETMKDMLKLDAPYDGTITEFMVDEGDNVKAKTPLFTIAKLDRMKIRVWISESERMQIKKGMKAIANVEGKTYVGKVSEISLSKNPMKQAFYADLIFDNSKREILPGLTADVQIVVYENKNAIAVPLIVVKKDDKGSYVYLAKGGVAKKQYVKIKNSNGVYYEIESGLKAGDSLIVKGILRLSDGVKIRVTK